METVIKKWGNSAAVRLPSAILGEAHAEIDSHFKIYVDSARRIILEPINDELDYLLSLITPENQQEEVDFGEPVGKELI